MTQILFHSFSAVNRSIERKSVSANILLTARNMIGFASQTVATVFMSLGRAAAAGHCGSKMVLY